MAALLLPLTDIFGGIAFYLFALFSFLMIPIAGFLYTLVYLFDCWPLMLSNRYLQERFGIPKTNLSALARRKEMKSPYWKAVGQGAIVGWAFMSMLLLGWWALTEKWSILFPIAIVVASAGNMAGQAWIVRHIVARAENSQNISAIPESGAVTYPS